MQHFRLFISRLSMRTSPVFSLCVCWLGVEAGGRACTARLHAATDDTRVVLAGNFNVEVSRLNATSKLSSMVGWLGFGFVCYTVRCLLGKWTDTSLSTIIKLECFQVLTSYGQTSVVRSEKEQRELKEHLTEQKCEWVRKQQSRCRRHFHCKMIQLAG